MGEDGLQQLEVRDDVVLRGVERVDGDRRQSVQRGQHRHELFALVDEHLHARTEPIEGGDDLAALPVERLRQLVQAVEGGGDGTLAGIEGRDEFIHLSEEGLDLLGPVGGDLLKFAGDVLEFRHLAAVENQ